MEHKIEILPNKKLDMLCAELGVIRGKSFRIKMANHKKATLERAEKLCIKSHMFESAYGIFDSLMVMGEYDEGWNAWYGGNEEVFCGLLEGIIVVNKEQTKKSSLA